MKKVLSRTEVADYFGVNPQTVSNWADAGLIKRLNKTTYSGASVEKLAKEFADVADITRQIRETRTELQALRDEVSMFKTERMFYYERERLSEIFAGAYQVVANKNPESKARSIHIVSSLISKRQSTAQLSEEYGVSATRICQLAEKSIRHFAKSVPAYTELDKELAGCKETIQEQNLLIEALENQVNQMNVHMRMIGVDAREVNIITEEYRSIYQMLNVPLKDFELSVRTLNITSFEGIKTVGDLIRRSRKELLKLRNFGHKSLMELDNLLESLNLHYETDVDRIIRAMHYSQQQSL